jgi:hypothetical protein
MLERILISLWSAWRQTAVHPAAPIWHRGRLAWVAAPRSCPASRALMQVQFVAHGVDPLVLVATHPLGF